MGRGRAQEPHGSCCIVYPKTFMSSEFDFACIPGDTEIISRRSRQVALPTECYSFLIPYCKMVADVEKDGFQTSSRQHLMTPAPQLKRGRTSRRRGLAYILTRIHRSIHDKCRFKQLLRK